MSDIDTVLVDSLKALDPKRPIREADVVLNAANGSFVPGSDICSAASLGSIWVLLSYCRSPAGAR